MKPSAQGFFWRELIFGWPRESSGMRVLDIITVLCCMHTVRAFAMAVRGLVAMAGTGRPGLWFKGQIQSAMWRPQARGFARPRLLSMQGHGASPSGTDFERLRAETKFTFDPRQYPFAQAVRAVLRIQFLRRGKRWTLCTRYAYTYVYIYICIHVCKYKHLWMYVHVYICISIFMSIYV